MSGVEKSIPEIWAEQVLRTHISPIFFSSLIGPSTPRPPRPWHKRQRTRFRLWHLQVRENIARAIYPEGPWDGDWY